MIGRVFVPKGVGLVVAWLAAVLPAAALQSTVLLQSTARGEFRHALVIGNATYTSGTLAAPPRDVAAVADAFGRAGFTVTKAENLATPADLDKAVGAFAKTVPTGGTALVYFSGHAVTVPVPTGTNPPRSDTGLMAVNGQSSPLSGVLRPLVVPAYAPYGNGWPPGMQSGSRINVVIVDAAPPPPPPAAAGAPPAASPPTPPPPPPNVDLLPDSLVVFRPADAATLAADAAGPSPLAAKLVAALAAGKPLDAALAGLSTRTMSSLPPAELARLAAPASKAVSPPETLGPGTKPGDEWVDKNGIVFCWCPPGEFAIGSPATEPGRQMDELPAVVAFAEGFWMAKHELCYRESLPQGAGVFMSTGEHKLHPVNKSHGFDSSKFLAAVNAAAPAGWEYDRPTEAQWEYAARAGTKTAYAFGDQPADLVRHGNFADKSLRESDAMSELAKGAGRGPSIYNGDPQTGLFGYAHRTWNDGSVTMARVGSYPSNAWGLCDMHGNVLEETRTIYDISRLAPYVPADKQAEWAAKPENKEKRAVSKGGSWLSTPDACRSASRSLGGSDNCNGMRFVLRRKGSAVEPPATRWTPLVPSAVAASSGATATPAPDGTVLLTGTAVAGDTYTVTCPVPAGVEPLALKLEVLPDPTLPKQGPGRAADGSYYVAEVSIAAKRKSGPPAAIEVLGVQPVTPGTGVGLVLDGGPDTFWGGPGDGKPHEAVFLIGLPSRTGHDAARWRYPLEAVTNGPLESLTITIMHRKDHPSPIGKFKISVNHE